MSTRRRPRPWTGESTAGTPGADALSRLLAGTLDHAASHPLLAPIRVATVSGEVVDRLLTAIAMGEFMTGDRLPPERNLATMLSISRDTAREALTRLDAMGVTEVRRGRTGGRFVRASWVESSAEAVRHTLLPRWDEVEQLLDLRALIEELVGRTAAERVTGTRLKEIHGALREYEEARTLRDEQVADAHFHHAILAATMNEQLVALAVALLAQTSVAFPCEPWGNEQMPTDDPDFRDALDDHREIYRALEARDIDRAGRLCRAHQGITTAMFRAVAKQAKAWPERPRPS